MNPALEVPGAQTDGDRLRPNEGEPRWRLRGFVPDVVRRLGRPVLISDIRGAAAEAGLDQQFAGLKLASLLSVLVKAGDLQVVGKSRGPLGENFFLPFDFSLTDFPLPAPLTWKDAVASEVAPFWGARVRKAESKSSKPTPFTTKEMRHHMKSVPGWEHKVKDRYAVSMALASLASAKVPLLRKIETENSQVCLWLPIECDAKSVQFENIFPTDQARVVEAVRRAMILDDTPAAARSRVQEIIDSDEQLTMQGCRTVAFMLSEVVRDLIVAGRGKRVKRVVRPLERAGAVGGEIYYWAKPEEGSIDWPSLDLAKQWVGLRAVEARWTELEPLGEIQAASGLSIPSIARARAQVLDAALRDIVITAPIETAKSWGESEAAALYRELTEKIDQARAQVALLLSRPGPQLPPAVLDEPIPRLTAEELQVVLMPVYPGARRVKKAIQLVPLLDRLIRRIPNPHYSRQKGGPPGQAAQYHFDRADALMYAAIEFGGPTCNLQGGLARATLGPLRSEAAVLPALDSPILEHRIAAAASLTFLRSPNALPALRRLALTDPEPGVRRVAVWGSGFTDPAEGAVLLRECLEREPVTWLRRVFRDWQREPCFSWWHV